MLYNKFIFYTIAYEKASFSDKSLLSKCIISLLSIIFP